MEEIKAKHKADALIRLEIRKEKREKAWLERKKIIKSGIILSFLSVNLDEYNIKEVYQYLNDNINYFLFVSILLSCYVVYSKMDKFVSIRFGKYVEEEKK